MAKKRSTNTTQASQTPVTEDAVMQEQEQLGSDTEQATQDGAEQLPATETVSAEGETVTDGAAETESASDDEQSPEGDAGEELSDVEEPAAEASAESTAYEPVTVEVITDPSVNWTVPVKTLVAVLDDYEVNMAPGRPQTPSTGELQQRALYRVLLGALSLEGADFTMAMDEICRRFAAGATGVYSESHALRFFEHLVLDSLERQRFRLLITTFQTLADPKSREVQLRFLDLATVARTLPDLGSQQRLLAYFRGV